jgi:DNA primase
MTPYDLFSKYLPDLKPDREQQLVKCIFHNDDTPSLSVNIKEGVFHCFGCGAKGGIKEFLKRVGENEQDWVKYTENIIQGK